MKQLPTKPKPLTLDERLGNGYVVTGPAPKRRKAPKDEECFLLADKYARTKKRWWIKIGVELNPENNEPDKLMYERVRRRYRGL